MSEPWRRLPALSLKQIQYFVTLAELRSFTATAHLLAISQPALSSALRQIESVLGGKLVNRTAQAVTLTDRGLAILPYAERMLNIAHNTFDDMLQIMAQGGDGTLRIGLVPSVSTLLFPAVPELLATRFPHLRVEFHDLTNDRLLIELEKGSIDFGLGSLDSTVPAKIEVFPLLEDPFVVVMRKDDPLADGHHLPWRHLARRPIAIFLKGNVSRLVNSLIESHRLSLDIAYRVDFQETLYGLVRSRLALAILPELYTSTLNDSELTVVHLQQPELTRTVVMMRTNSPLRSPQTEQCFQYLLQAFHQRLKLQSGK
ncbi:LysR family transcriptional regulator [Rouxiella sp. S1S-2]|uniref:LysR family transcriptional regulator n=1 Tax=Rouxiella sp. S1S-2 TaxID=2653856 RepID=UPI00126455EC|nr:LysR family transcriptional regulator [Rouxiella sp. S1S-2]KAB7898082.1 LysR family transcriptional regulator [Rouxiella sp. S1S-2]